MQPEARLRSRCAKFLRSHAPGLWFTAIEHGRAHAGTPEQRAREWGRLQAQGVRQGLADMLLMPACLPDLWVEMKHGTNKQSEAQVQMQRDMQAIGRGYVVVRSVEQLGEVCEAHGIQMAPGWRVAAQIHDAALDVPKPLAKARKAGAAKPRASRAQIARGNRLALASAKGWGG